MARNVIKIGEVIHATVERALKEVSVKKRRQRTPAQEEALRLRVETAARERADFGVKTSTFAGMNEDPDEEVQEDDKVTQVDYDTERFLMPTVLEQLADPGSSLTGQSIDREIYDNGLAPFVEGTPIGVCYNHPKQGPAPMLKTLNQIMDEKCAALRERQRRNDRRLARLLEEKP